MLLDICNTYSALSVIALIKVIMQIIFIAVPIILLVLTTVDIAKITKNPEDSNASKIKKTLIIRVVITLFIFLIPILVNIFSSKEFLNIGSYKNTSCWINSSSEYLAALKEAEEADKEAKKEERLRRQKETDARRELAVEARSKIEAVNAEEAKKIAEAEKKRQEEEVKRYKLKRTSGGGINATNMTGLGAKVVETAKREYSGPDNHKRPNKYTCSEAGYCSGGYKSSMHWCAMFVSWVLKEAGAYPTQVEYKGAGVRGFGDYFKRKGQYELSQGHGGNYIPTGGDIILFSNSNRQGDYSHIGIVEGVADGNVWIIDGNANDLIKHRPIRLNDKYIIGYGAWQK